MTTVDHSTTGALNYRALLTIARRCQVRALNPRQPLTRELIQREAIIDSKDTVAAKLSAGRLAADARVVFLVNFLSPNLVEVMRGIARRVRRLDILVSVPMEANRQFSVDSQGLHVTCQKTWTKRKVVLHPGGYSEELFVHVPRDTWAQLRRLQPDCLVSLEMGVRSLQSALYRLSSRSMRHVLAVYGSERSEAGRGRVRTWLRRFLLRSADRITYNGPSCQRYLLAQGAPAERMLPWNYAADPDKIYRGPLSECSAPGRAGQLRLLTISQLIARKGIDRAIEQLSSWARGHSQLQIHWAIAGTGPQSAQLQKIELPENLVIQWLGHCDGPRLKELYASYPINFFPTLGDEWGLVVDEALGSGQLVLGSLHAQACETLLVSPRNGWLYNPDQPQTLGEALQAILQVDDWAFHQMRQQARHSVIDRSPEDSARQFVAAVQSAIQL